MKEEVFWKNPGYISAPSLQEDISADFLIAGGGIAGVMAAHFLIENGIKPGTIVLLERRVIGSGSTGRSAGMLLPEPENEKNAWWDALIDRYGFSRIRSYHHAHRAMIESLENLVHVAEIECEAAKQQYLIMAKNRTARARVESDIAARQSLGERPRSLIGRKLYAEFRSPRFIFAERTAGGLSVNPLALVQGIAAYLRRLGVRVYENTTLETIERGGARTVNGTVNYVCMLNALGMGDTHLALHRYFTTIAVTEPLSHPLLERIGLEDKDMFIDEEGEHPFHYGKVTKDRRLLVGYGDVAIESATAELPLHAPHIRQIRNFLKRLFMHEDLSIEYGWSGGYAMAPGFLPAVVVEGNSAHVNGAGIQLSTMVASDYAVAKLLKKEHALDGLWGETGTSSVQ